MAKFEKGHKRIGGNTKGMDYKSKRTAREIFEACLGKTIPERIAELMAKEPRKELDILTSMMAYCYPKPAPFVVTEEKTEEKDDAILTEIIKADEPSKPS